MTGTPYFTHIHQNKLGGPEMPSYSGAAADPSQNMSQPKWFQNLIWKQGQANVFNQGTNHVYVMHQLLP